jgi:hypothetical protein
MAAAIIIIIFSSKNKNILLTPLSKDQLHRISMESKR